MGKIVAVANSKGGVGKSTLASNLIVEALRLGLRTRAIDADPQKSLAIWRAARPEHLEQVRLSEQTTTGLKNEAWALAEESDLVVIDCAGKDGKVLRTALLVADLVVVPVIPSSPDAWAYEQFFQVLEDAAVTRGEMEVRVVFNQCEPRTKLEKKAREIIEDLGQVISKVTIKRRVAWREAFGEGLGVSEYQAKSAAALESRNLFKELGLNPNSSSKKVG